MAQAYEPGRTSGRKLRGPILGRGQSGTTWDPTRTELQSALLPAIAETEIWVAAGVYFPDWDPGTQQDTADRHGTFQMKSAVARMLPVF